jgi:N-acetyltransferase
MQIEFDLQPELREPTLTLRPLREGDQEPLWEVARDPLIWEQHPDKSRADRAGFLRFFQQALDSRGALVVLDAGGKVIGSSRYYELDVVKREVAIGYTFLARSHWGGEANRKMKRLMIEHAAPAMDVIWFHVATTNLRSRRAMEKIGAVAAFVGPRPLNGETVDFIYYRIDACHWRPQLVRS